MVETFILLARTFFALTPSWRPRRASYKEKEEGRFFYTLMPNVFLKSFSNFDIFMNWTDAVKHLYYKVRCVFVCGNFDVQLTSPPVLKLWDTQGYLWLSYDLTKVIKLIGETFGQKKNIFQKNTLCHSFCICVILFVLLSFFPDYCSGSEYCHSFRIIQRITNTN